MQVPNNPQRAQAQASRAERRRQGAIQRKILRLIRRDGDVCTLCRAPFTHNCTIYYGTSASGAVACVGECCADRLQGIYALGVFCTSGHDLLTSRDVPQPQTLEEAVEAVVNLRSCIAAADQISADVCKRAGLNKNIPLHMGDDPWMADDRAWFAAHPDRSHRLRDALPDEPCTKDRRPPVIPPGHHLQILVRQVSPGLRVRMGFAHNYEVPIPHIEPLLHALGDLIAAGNNPITTDDVAALALKYARTIGPI